jgi:hypothetical protein
MSDFVRGLRAELVSAAAREQERRLPHLWAEPRLLLAAAAGVAALAAVIVLLASGGVRTEPAPAPSPTDSPAPDGRELFGGSLEPNVRYRTRTFVPALSFSVADGLWLVPDATKTDLLLMERRRVEQGLEGPPTGFLAFLRLHQVFDPGTRGLDASLTAAPGDLYEWLRAHPDLRVGEASPVTVGGVPGESFRAQVRFQRPVHSDPDCRRRFLVTCTLLAPYLSLQDGTRLRVTILRTEPDPLVVTLDARDEQALAGLEEAARPVLDSLRIGVR